jgi:hypothetical protein
LTLLALLTLSTLPAVADEARVYGADLEAGEPVSVAELLSRPDDFVGERVRVEGRIDGVCPRRGCWIDIREDDGKRKVRFKVEDGEIEFPVEVNGKHVVAEGVFARTEMTPEQALAYAKHLAEELGEPFDEASFDGPYVIYRIDGIGARVE